MAHQKLRRQWIFSAMADNGVAIDSTGSKGQPQPQPGCKGQKRRKLIEPDLYMLAQQLQHIGKYIRAIKLQAILHCWATAIEKQHAGHHMKPQKLKFNSASIGQLVNQIW